MKIETLANSKDYFDQVLRPNVDAFFNHVSTFSSAFNMASALFHFHEWLFQLDQAAIESLSGRAFSSPGDFWKHVESEVPEAAFVRDLANASKHVRLTIRPSTSMTHVANTVIQSAGYGEGGYGRGPYGGSGAVVLKDVTGDVYFDVCAKKLFAFWKTLIDQIHPQAAA